MSRFILLGSAALCMLLAQSCTTGNEDTLKTTGTIAQRSDAFDFKGFFFIEGDDGVEYYPTNLPDDCQKVGLRIRFEARVLDEHPLIVGWNGGPKVELLHIQRL